MSTVGCMLLLLSLNVCFGHELYNAKEILKRVVEILNILVKDKESIPDQNSTCPQCPDMWIPFKGFCYLFVDEKRTFGDAKHHCAQSGGHLVHIGNETENTFLKNHLKKMKGVFYWIGLTDIDEEGIFKWYDTDEVASFTDWGPSRPNNEGNQDCGFMHPGFNFMWDDYDCGTRQKSICEKRAK